MSIMASGSPWTHFATSNCLKRCGTKGKPHGKCGVSLMTPSFWRGKRVFLTGHTGFKGSWLSLWLQSFGAEIQGYALEPPTSPNLFEIARIGEGMSSTIADVRDYASVARSLAAFRPEIIIHMAAQPRSAEHTSELQSLMRNSYA